MFTPIKNQKMYMLVVEQIKMSIEEGKLKVGDRLPSERELSKQFSLSRSTIREALTALEMLGIVEIRTGLGSFICSSSQINNSKEISEELNEGTSPTEIFEARIIIEPQLARIAAQRATNDDLQEILKVLNQSELLCDNKIEEFEDIDKKFHLLIARAAHNETLYRFEESISSERMGRLWGNLKLKSLQKEGRIKLYKEEHKAIFNAIFERNPSLAEQLTKKHLHDIKKHIFGE